METGKVIPLKEQLIEQLKWLKPDDEGTPEEFNAYNNALRALERHEIRAVEAYIKETRAKLGIIEVKPQLNKD